jgi:enoyl-[acyl-carrier protein] reductase II
VHSFDGNRVVADTGARYPIFNAPIGFMARSDIVGAVSRAGGMGLLELHANPIKKSAREYDLIKESTEAPFGMHMILRGNLWGEDLDAVIDFALAHTAFMTTGLGDPTALVPKIKDAGVKVYHQVGTLREAQKAVDAGVDGLIVEGAEAGGVRSTRALHMFSLLQQIRANVDVPIVAAGGVADGFGMAGAFALGAEGVIMGTRFLSAVECPAHHNWKQAIADCDITITANPMQSPDKVMRAVRNDFSEAVAVGEGITARNGYGGDFLAAFYGGELDKAMVGAGETASLISHIKPAAEIIEDTVTVFWQEINRLARLLNPVPSEA